MSAPKVWFSTIEYRPSPPDPETGVIGLGFVIEFTTDKYWVVTAVMRAGIEVPELAGLDNLARQVLQHRLEVIQKEIDRVAALAKEPGQVLASLFTSNPWSLHISEPKEIEASIEIADASVERVQDEYVFSVYETQWLPIVQARERARAAQLSQQAATQKPSIVGPRITIDVPPPWLLPPSKIVRPLIRAR